MNTTIKIVLRKKARKDGRFPINLRVTKAQKSKFISLNMYCKENEFESEQFKRNYLNYRQKNQILMNLKTKALKILDDYSLNQRDFTLEEFEAKFRGKKSHHPNIIEFFDEIISEMVRAGRISNANAYKETKTALVKFKGATIYFADVTPEFLEKFEVFLREKGNQNGGIAFKMRELRAIFNKAIMRDIISQEIYPFKYYKISRLKSRPNKRALKIDEFKRIRDVDIAKYPHLLEAYHYFLFSFYTRGMNFIDMMKLRWSQIKNGRIYYNRSKTKGNFSIEITPKVQEILSYYQNQNRPTEFVFPILLSKDLTHRQIANRKHKVLSRYNKKLKKLGKIAKVESKLTSYVARHSFATILKQKGTSTDIISELMGHADVNITMTYLKEFDNEVLDRENRKLMDL